jgi:Interferon-related developmental regulator (IFRD)
MLAGEPDDTTEVWRQDIADRIEEIIDRKRSSTQGRETTLTAYVHYLMSRYAFDEINDKVSEILPALLKSVKAESSEKETCLALRGALSIANLCDPHQGLTEL